MLYLMACLLLFTNLIYYSYLITCHEINYSYPIKIKGGIILKDKSNVYLPSLRSYYDPTNETCVNNPLIKSDALIYFLKSVFDSGFLFKKSKYSLTENVKKPLS